MLPPRNLKSRSSVRMLADPRTSTPRSEGLAWSMLTSSSSYKRTLLLLDRTHIAAAAAANRLPTVYGYREHVETGGLISYGVNLDYCFHRAATYVYKILRGTPVSDLPIEFPTKLELIINLRTAKALGLEISPMLLVRADEVIE